MGVSNFSSWLYNSIRNVGDRIISFENKVDAAEVFTRIEQEAIYFDGVDRKGFWTTYSRQPIADIHPSLVKVVSQFEKEGIKDKTVLDLGCGKANSTLYLLEKGWRVIAVDYSQEALDNLKAVVERTHPEWLENGQLTLVCENIETYQFPKNVSVVLANRILPYLNPLKIREIWNKIYGSLAKGWLLVGLFYPWVKDPVQLIGLRALAGAWFTDINTVKGLLEDKNYEEVEFCQSRFSNAENIEFVAKKSISVEPANQVEEPLGKKKALFTINLSSYFDAVRGLPSKDKFPHVYARLADAVVLMRETCKITALASGAIALTNALFQLDGFVSSAPHAFAASIGAWFLFKQFAQSMEPRVKAYINKVRSIDYTQSQELKFVMEQIKTIQNHEEIQPFFNPPPPLTAEDQFMQFLGRLGIPPEEVRRQIAIAREEAEANQE